MTLALILTPQAIVAGSAVPCLMFILWNSAILGAVDVSVAADANANGGVFDPLEVLRAGGGGEELGAVISVLKRAKPLQLEPAVGPLYQALRKHAKALHAARRSGVAVPSHKPAAKTMALSAPSTTQSALEQLADVACAGQWLIADQ